MANTERNNFPHAFPVAVATLFGSFRFFRQIHFGIRVEPDRTVLAEDSRLVIPSGRWPDGTGW